jgi:tetraacyldisaccharide 4'-kinase
MLNLLSRCLSEITNIRFNIYKSGLLTSYKSSIPIICVGNISAGGNGKTPMVEFLVKTLTKNKRIPVVLTRGYGGKLKGPLLVNSYHSVDEIGDEAMLHRNNGLVVISTNKSLGAKFIEQQNLGDIIILDDGYQHFALSRDLNLLMQNLNFDDQENLFDSNKILYREKINNALSRAHCIIFVDRRVTSIISSLSNSIIDRLPKTLPIFRAGLKLQSISSVIDNHIIKIENFSKYKKVLIVSGVANPTGFIDTIKNIFKVEPVIKIFPDHYGFKKNELNTLIKKYPDYIRICTSKDAVKIRELCVTGYHELKTELWIEPEEKLMNMIISL